MIENIMLTQKEANDTFENLTSPGALSAPFVYVRHCADTVITARANVMKLLFVCVMVL